MNAGRNRLITTNNKTVMLKLIYLFISFLHPIPRCLVLSLTGSKIQALNQTNEEKMSFSLSLTHIHIQNILI